MLHACGVPVHGLLDRHSSCGLKKPESKYLHNAKAEKMVEKCNKSTTNKVNNFEERRKWRVKKHMSIGRLSSQLFLSFCFFFFFFAHNNTELKHFSFANAARKNVMTTIKLVFLHVSRNKWGVTCVVVLVSHRRKNYFYHFATFRKQRKEKYAHTVHIALNESAGNQFRQDSNK